LILREPLLPGAWDYGLSWINGKKFPYVSMLPLTGKAGLTTISVFFRHFEVAMKRYAFFILLFVLVSMSILPLDRANCKENPASSHFDKSIPLLMERYGIPGTVILLIEEGGIIWEKAYGYSDIAQGKKMKRSVPCMAHSISKSVTAWGVMKLIEEGKVDPDEPIGTYFTQVKLPERDPLFKTITTRQLLSNSSGLGLGIIGVHYHPSEELPDAARALFEELEMAARPGKGFIYSNQGFKLLELLIEEVTDRDFSEYMDEEVLKPLGMENSGFRYSEERFGDVPKGYTIDGRTVPVYLYAGKASGGLFATGRDIARFVSAGMVDFSKRGLAVLERESIEELYVPHIEISGLFSVVFDSYGLGYFIETLPDGSKALSHGGQGLGWMTHFHFVPEKGCGIVILTNSQRSWPMFSEILDDWARYNGFPSIGMGIIRKGQVITRLILVVLFIVSVYLLAKFVVDIAKSRRGFNPLSKNYMASRIIQAAIAVGLYSLLVWSLNQEYLFITSIFPATAPWIAYFSLFFATVLLMHALFPVRDRVK
jgi:CubicO group peptidase (beta-lactamase class C family)